MSTERGPRRALFLFLGSLAAVGAAAVTIGRWLDAVAVRGRSMAPTLLPGDRLLVESMTYRRRRPRAGEIVLAHDPRQPDRELVKRIGLVDTASGSAELVGDAPDASTDSRSFGPVALGDLRWRAVARYWPPQRIARLESAAYDRDVDDPGASDMLAFAVDARERMVGLDSRSVFDAVESRYPDLLAASNWFAEHDRLDDAFALVTAITPFWMATKRLAEGGAEVDRLLALRGGDPSRRGMALFSAGYLAFWQGDDQRSSGLLNQGLALGREVNDPTVTAVNLVGLARIALRTDPEEARRLCREALAVTEGTSDSIGRSHALHVSGVAAQMLGDLPGARKFMTERIALARQTGNFATISSEGGNLSMVERQLGNLDEAEALSCEALEIDERRGDELAIPWKLNGLAAVVAARGDLPRAATLLGAADSLLEAAGGGWPPDEKIQHDGTLDTLRAGLDPSAYAADAAAGSAMTARQALDFALGRAPAKP